MLWISWEQYLQLWEFFNLKVILFIKLAEKNDQITIALRLMAMFGPALLYWYHYSNSGLRI